MNAIIFSFTRNGARISLKLKKYLESRGFESGIFTTRRYKDVDPALKEISPSLQEMCREAFSRCRLMVFIGATGIAIRSIAPYIRSKTKDPAVVSIDEQGKFVIPLLSGHIGGANGLALGIAGFLRAVPVITTATDVNDLFAVDEWAARHNMSIFNMDAAKTFASYLVDCKKVGVKSDFPIKGPLPKGLVLANEGTVGMAISLRKTVQPFVETVVLRPRVLHLGIGCRRGTPEDKIEELVIQELAKLKVTMSVVKGIASIDVKKDEQGLLAFAESNALPVRFYSAEELNAVEGDFTPSAFVAKTVGVDNVCERAAVLDSHGGKLLLRKTGRNGVTLAVAAENFVVDFNS
ncbi:MAG: cobalt-precorrin 5A hydrolase [Acidaminococcaceae bacterium]|nr:cobalt-precorrin 5A hydrolase [Acidaminococcaceae bacterium]HBX75879.1 cobalamin biosynthesis protein CbiG [Acidaminococcaceae bacterium]